MLAGAMAGSLAGAGSGALAILGSLYHSEWAATAGISLGTGVSAWANLTTRGNLVQATGSKQPAYSASAFNGGPCIVTDGVDDELRAALTGLGIGQRPYCWCVLQRVAGIGAADYVASLVDAVPNGANYNALHVEATGWRQDRGSSDGTTVVDSGVAPTNVRRLAEWGLTAGGLDSLVVDGEGTNSVRTGALGGALNFLQLGVVGNGSAPSNVRFAHILIASNEPSAAQKLAMRAYLRGANFPAYTGGSYGLP